MERFIIYLLVVFLAVNQCNAFVWLHRDYIPVRREQQVRRKQQEWSKPPDVYGPPFSFEQERHEAPNCKVQPLGLENGDIPDASITASIYRDSYYPPHAGRLGYEGNFISKGSWEPEYTRPGEWLQVDLGERTKIDAIATQGSPMVSEWTKTYSLQYSYDGRSFTDYEHGKIFVGNSDQNSIVTHYLEPAITARYVRLLPKTWYAFIAVRMELYGSCIKIKGSSKRRCKALGMQSRAIPDSSITASSTFHNIFPPKDARLNNIKKSQYSMGAWGLGGGRYRLKDWIQVDLGKVTIVTGIATQGSSNGDHYIRWVKKYFLKYSNDSTVFQDYLYAKRLEGNTDENTIVKHDLYPPIVARYVRLYPATWHGFPGLRMELYGCKQEIAPKTTKVPKVETQIPESDLDSLSARLG